MKIFYFTEKLDTIPPSNPSILNPLNIRIKPTNICNHSCWYCAYRLGNLQLGKNMDKNDFIPLDKMIEIIDDLDRMNVKAVTFSGGGEPFCYPFFLETLKKLSTTSIRFAALTNGSLLNGELAEIFANYGTWLRISLDGWDDESYAKYRGVDYGDFSLLLKNMKSFMYLNGNCYLGVCINVDKNNAPHLLYLVKKLKDAGVNSVKIAPCLISNESEKNNNYHFKIKNIVREQVDTIIDTLSDTSFELYDSYHMQLKSFQKQYTYCPSIQIVPVIGADLNVYSCQDKAYNIDNGFLFSIKNKSFNDAWYKNKENFFKINPENHCNHHCVNNGRNEFVWEYLHADKRHVSFV